MTQNLLPWMFRRNLSYFKSINESQVLDLNDICFIQGDPVVVLLLHELSMYEGDWSILPALPR